MEQRVSNDSLSWVNKQAIADAFGRAAKSYDQHAAFQRDVGERLLAKMPEDLSGKTVLDIGCGTGYFSYELLKRGAQVICFDLSPDMLEAAKEKCGDDHVMYKQGDAEQLPFANNSVDYVFSSLALQWCDDLAIPLREIKRVVRPQGQAFLSTLLDGSLFELKKAWAKIDSYQHVNEFISANQVKIALAQSECHSHQLDLAPITVWYDTAFALMRDLKGIGATHVDGRAQGLTNRKALLGVDKAYQTHRNHQGLLPATYQVCLGVIQL
ncbi:malonyl-[acyl-carrier protein] O-methyltransferase BioC [Vibrio aquaticus]|uniref:Malonyl-[acyl-carrier protein] O-methyltransferase n=1 Tax=Vibrio aquaticus TaxID=2496559 RepID=A0A3S0P622_9VIBR|nr:malonyl-ACP O-methyltransferase BioC [Vibrio aquaticus]RTZ15649.1 malonyl-[acyl-carrier protein] O-methyltransferase BioC [Vibrio aquaticus]